MNEFDRKQALKPFLSEVLNSDMSSEQDKAILYVMATLVEEVEPSGETERVVHLEKDSDGRYSAYSDKLANLRLKDVSFWMNILAKVASVVAANASAHVDGGKLASAILALLSSMLGKEARRVEFNEQDAKILFAIAGIMAGTQVKTFSKGKLRNKLEELSGKAPGDFNIKDDRIDQSLKKLADHGVLDRDIRDGIYVVREKIKAPKQK